MANTPNKAPNAAKPEAEKKAGKTQLFNKSDRIIYCDKSYAFAPQTVHAFEADEAARLTRLYPHEVLDVKKLGEEDAEKAAAAKEAAEDGE